MKHDQEITALFEQRGWTVIRFGSASLRKKKGITFEKNLYRVQKMLIKRRNSRCRCLHQLKTEQRAVNALAIIDEHSTMVHQFNGNDKEMSWDGYIWLYKKNDGTQSKSNFDGRVSVQIKGHNDPQHNF